MKRFVSIILAMLLVFACTVSVSAVDTVSETDTVTNINLGSDIMPLADQWFICLDHGSTSTSETRGKFIVGSIYANARLSVSATVDAPCTLFVYFYDVNGNTLGSSSITFTKATTVTSTPSPSSLSTGTYYYGYEFSKSGISYTISITAIA